MSRPSRTTTIAATTQVKTTTLEMRTPESQRGRQRQQRLGGVLRGGDLPPSKLVSLGGDVRGSVPRQPGRRRVRRAVRVELPPKFTSQHLEEPLKANATAGPAWLAACGTADGDVRDRAGRKYAGRRVHGPVLEPACLAKRQHRRMAAAAITASCG